MTNQAPAPGWYPAPHANNEQRYWDGARWLEPSQTAATAVMDAPTPGSPRKAPAGFAIGALVAGIVAFLTGLVPVLGALIGAAAIVLGILAMMRKQRKGLAIAGIVLGALALISSISVAVGITGGTPTAKPAAVQTTEVTPSETAQAVEAAEPSPTEVSEPEKPAIVMITVPDVTGMSSADAAAAITAAGLTPPASLQDPTAKVLSTTPAANTETEQGATVTFTLEEKPQFSLSQKNAIAKAKAYLNYAGFSRTGLIGQLEYEGFSTEDATFGADNAGADWNAECAEKAQSYLDYSAFSRDGLADQLAFEGFEPSEIEFALAAVGY